MAAGKSLCHIPKYSAAFEEYRSHLGELSIKFIVACEADLPWEIPRCEAKWPRTVGVLPPVVAVARDPAFVQRVGEGQGEFRKKGAVGMTQMKYDGGWGERGYAADGCSLATEVLGEPLDDIEVVADTCHGRLRIAHAVEGEDDIAGGDGGTIVECGPFAEGKGVGGFIAGYGDVRREVGH